MTDAPALMRAMARNNAWAGRTLHAACARLSPEAFEAPRTGFFGSIGATLRHVLAVDRYYLDALEQGGRGRAVYDDPEPQGQAALAAAQAEADARLIRFCEALRAEDLPRELPTDRGEAGRVSERIDALLLHLFQHQIHHRGQAHAMLSETSVAPPQLDDFHLGFGRAADAEGPF